MPISPSRSSASCFASSLVTLPYNVIFHGSYFNHNMVFSFSLIGVLGFPLADLLSGPEFVLFTRLDLEPFLDF